jgi:S1-C subfamily serine protease
MTLRAAALATTVEIAQARSNAARPPAANLAACNPPAGFHGNAVKLNAELLQGLLAQPDALKAIVQPVEGGMTVRSDSGFATMLGLKQGDRVRLANGIPLTTTEDVVAAVIKPLVANQPVRLTGTRGGQAQEMLLLNAGACP